MNKEYKRTKIIATVGPSNNSKEKLWQLYKAGADIFRLNFSHGSHEEHLKVINAIKELNEKYNSNICILQDLQGPKIRTGDMENDNVQLKEGEKIIITNEDVLGTSEKISTSYKNLPYDAKKGDCILVDDGKIELRVVESNQINEVTAEIVYGGTLKSKKGMNLPDTRISEPSLTPKDRDDLLFGLENDVDWVALSFVRTADEIREIQEIIESQGRDTKTLAKIEKPEAIDNIDEIIETTDGIMVARGDLGVEIDMAKVPLIQKDIVRKCNRAAKPVIIATQMLESMIESPRPTRAETNDVANAIMDGTDVVMLSAESAAGMYPVESVNSMTRIIIEVEQSTDEIYHKNFNLENESPTILNDSVVSAACNLARYTNAKCIIGRTESGYTAFRIASHRPKAKIFVFTRNKSILNRLMMVWGVDVIYYDKYKSLDDTIEDIKNVVIERGYLKKGDVFINTGSTPVDKRLKTNMLKLSVVE